MIINDDSYTNEWVKRSQISTNLNTETCRFISTEETRRLVSLELFMTDSCDFSWMKIYFHFQESRCLMECECNARRDRKSWKYTWSAPADFLTISRETSYRDLPMPKLLFNEKTDKLSLWVVTKAISASWENGERRKRKLEWQRFVWRSKLTVRAWIDKLKFNDSHQPLAPTSQGIRQQVYLCLISLM